MDSEQTDQMQSAECVSPSPKYIEGKRNIHIYDIERFCQLIETQVFIPLISPLKIEKKNNESIIFYELKLQETNTGTTKSPLIVVPEKFSSSISFHENEYGLDFQWESSSDEEEEYFFLLDKLLSYWKKSIQRNNVYQDKEPFLRKIESTLKLKWPWKKDPTTYSIDESQQHVLKVGCGYYSCDEKVCGISLQLSQYPEDTQSKKQEKLMLRKRKRVRSDTVEDETHVEQVSKSDELI